MAGEDRELLRWVKTLDCMAPGAPEGCSDVTEANHGTGVRERGLQQKAHDDTATPLCTQHHRDWDNNSGPFKGWTQEQRRTWLEDLIITVRCWWDARCRRGMPAWF